MIYYVKVNGKEVFRGTVTEAMEYLETHDGDLYFILGGEDVFRFAGSSLDGVYIPCLSPRLPTFSTGFETGFSLWKKGDSVL
jgi:hypothetical protein